MGKHIDAARVANLCDPKRGEAALQLEIL